MKSLLGTMFLLGATGCASLQPADHAGLVRAMPGQKPLRVGVVMLAGERALQPAFAEPSPAPGGAAPLAAVGTVYCEQAVLPASLPGGDLLDAVAGLDVFTDVVPLPFDGRGVASRAAMIQRVQDRIWPMAVAQQLDALLVVEGVRDGGLRWSGADEGLFSLDTVLWWLTWPVGLWIPDRDYTADVSLVAELFWVGDPRSTPVATDATANVGPHSLSPWQRAKAPALGLVLPPAWLGDDEPAVAAAVSEWSRAMLPIELARRLKQSPLSPSTQAQLQVHVRDGQLEIVVRSGQDLTDAVVASLPRGALTEAVEAVPVPLATKLELTAQGPVHVAGGSVDMGAVRQAALPLLRVCVTLVSGEQVSQTWTWSDVERGAAR